MALEFLALGRRENQTLGKGVQISMGAQAPETALWEAAAKWIRSRVILAASVI